MNVAHKLKSTGEMPQSLTRRSGEVRLTEEEWHRVDRALKRLHEALREFITAWPIDQRSPTRLSQALNVDQTTCQRLTSLAKAGYRGAAMLESLPGTRAFRNVIAASKRIGGSPAARVLAQLRAAVDGFDEVLQDCGGSLSELKRRVAASHSGLGTEAPEDSDLHARRTFFRAASQLAGRHAQTTASIGLYDTVNVARDELRHLRISAGIGIVAQPNAVPMVLEAFDAQTTETDDGWQRSLMLLEEFTSAPWKTVELEPSPGFRSQALEIDGSQDPSDTCFYTAFPVPHPRTLDKPIEESWYILYNPCASLVFDVYLHKSIARQCLVSLDVHLWQTSFANHPHGCWHTRMPQSPPIIQLGRGLSNCETTLCPRQRELTAELFRRADVDPNEYVGFRCAERYPVWRAGYRFELDFGSSGD